MLLRRYYARFRLLRCQLIFFWLIASQMRHMPIIAAALMPHTPLPPPSDCHTPFDYAIRCWYFRHIRYDFDFSPLLPSPPRHAASFACCLFAFFPPCFFFFFFYYYAIRLCLLIDSMPRLFFFLIFFIFFFLFCHYFASAFIFRRFVIIDDFITLPLFRWLLLLFSLLLRLSLHYWWCFIFAIYAITPRYAIIITIDTIFRYWYAITLDIFAMLLIFLPLLIVMILYALMPCYSRCFTPWYDLLLPSLSATWLLATL